MTIFSKKASVISNFLTGLIQNVILKTLFWLNLKMKKIVNAASLKMKVIQKKNYLKLMIVNQLKSIKNRSKTDSVHHQDRNTFQKQKKQKKFKYISKVV